VSPDVQCWGTFVVSRFNFFRRRGVMDRHVVSRFNMMYSAEMVKFTGSTVNLLEDFRRDKSSYPNV
jgi:hypothetical protein